MTRGALLGAILAAIVVWGCGRDSERVVVDVTPHLRALASDDEAAADEAADALVGLGQGAVPALAAALDRDAPPARSRIVEVLRRIGGDAAVLALVRTASHEADVDTRAAALRALAAAGDPRGRDVVVTALDDPQPAVRYAAYDACATLCGEPSVIEKIAQVAVHDPDVTAGLVARRTIERLRQRGAEAAIRPAVGRVAEPALSEGAPDTRARAALVLDDDPRALSILVTLAPSVSPDLQQYVAFVLGDRGDATAVAPLATLLGAGNPMVQFYAVDALRKLKERGVSGADQALANYTGPRPWGPLRPPELS